MGEEPQSCRRYALTAVRGEYFRVIANHGVQIGTLPAKALKHLGVSSGSNAIVQWLWRQGPLSALSGSPCLRSLLPVLPEAVGKLRRSIYAQKILLDFVNLKINNARQRYREEALEKTILRILASCVFSHSLAP